MILDQKTRLAVKVSLLESALAALRKAITHEDDDACRTELTNAAALVAQHKRDADQRWADLREAEARFATTVLEA